jgi:hypothetical protein
LSSIPPDIASSALQAGYQQREASRISEAARASSGQASQRNEKAIDAADMTVHTDDVELSVYADAEGGGSQGRESEGESADDENAPDSPADSAVTTDDDGLPHLDVQA